MLNQAIPTKFTRTMGADNSQQRSSTLTAALISPDKTHAPWTHVLMYMHGFLVTYSQPTSVKMAFCPFADWADYFTTA